MEISIYRTKIHPKKRGGLQVFTTYPKSLQPSEIVRYDMSDRTTIMKLPTYFYNTIIGIMCKELLGHELEDLYVTQNWDVGHEIPLHHILHFSPNEGFIGPKAVQEIYGFLMETEVEDFTPERLGRDEHHAIITFIQGIRSAARKKEYLEFKTR